MKKLGECLIQAGLITQEDLHAALAEQRRTGDRIGVVLMRLNLVTEKQVTKALAHQIGLPYASLIDDPPERAAIAIIPRAVARQKLCIGIKLENQVLTAAIADPLSPDAAADLKRLTGHTIRLVVATRSEILESIVTGYPPEAVAPLSSPAQARSAPAIIADDSSTTPLESAAAVFPVADDRMLDPRGQPQPIRNAAADASVDDLLALVVHRAIASGATDVHIDPREHGALVRHRIDGVLTEPLDLPQWARDALVARIKQRAGLDAIERRSPQSGRMRFATAERDDVDFRVFTLPTLFGERVVLRALKLRRAALPLEELGLSTGSMAIVRDFLRHAHGMILVAGPSGSGTTTTLASALSTMQSAATSIVTIEPAVEYQIAGVNQTELNDTAPFSMAAALQAVLQQDPDVLLIGDLRDSDSARIVVRAAQKRQLVLAALHADSAAAAVSQLAALSIEPSLIGSSLIGVIAQRLVRRLCVACRRQYTPDSETLRALSIPDTSAAEMVFYHAVGCDQCHHTGFHGRIALYEVMRITDDVRRLIAQNAGEDVVRHAALEAGMVPLGEDGLGKVKAGVTTADELLRVLAEVRQERIACPECAAAVSADFNVCPRCAHRLSGGCHKCGRALQADWQYCPYCAATTHKKTEKTRDYKALDLPASNVAEFKNQNR